MVKPPLVRREALLDFRDIFRRENPAQVFPLSEKNLLFFGYARAALYEGLRILGLGEGDTVLVPEYVCNAVVAPMHCLKVNAKFYKVEKGLSPSWDGLDEMTDKSTKALLICDYFGFPNDLVGARLFCDKHKLFLIEDNACGFLSCDAQRPLGGAGDISIFSFRKTVPLPNGAALLVNNKAFEQKLQKPEYLRRRTNDFRFLLKILALGLENSLFSFARPDEVEDFEANRIRDRIEEFNLSKYFVSISSLSAFLLRRFDFEGIKAQRRRMYEGWLRIFSGGCFSGARAVFPVLPDGVVPFCFPVLADDRGRFIATMFKKGIESFPWPYLPRDSKEEYLSARMVCLPVFPDFKLSGICKGGFIGDA